MESSLRKYVIACILILVCGQSTWASNKQLWSVTYYEDKSAILSADSALQLYLNNRFTPLAGSTLNPGFTISYFWMAVSLQSGAPDLDDDWHLVVKNPHINRLHWYRFDGDNLTLINESGDYLPYATRMVDNTYFAYPLLPQYSIYLLKIDKRHETLQLPLAIVNRAEIQQMDVRENLFYGIFCGAVIILLIFSLFVYANTRNKIYLLFFAHVLMEAIWLLADKGIGTRYFWPDFIYLASRSRMFFTLLGIVASLEFTKNFIRLEKPKLSWKSVTTIQAVAALTAAVVISPLPFDTQPWMVNILAVNSMILWGIVFFIIPVIVVLQWRKGVKEAKIFALSHVPVLVLGMFINFHNAGLLPLPEFLLQFGLAFGNLITMLILLFGITFVFNEYKSENLVLLSQINEQQKILTQRVLEAQELERKAIGQAIHDEVSAKLSVSMLHLSAIKPLQADVAEGITAIHGSLNEVRTTLRDISHQLMPVDLGKYGLRKSIEGFFGSVIQSKKLKIEYAIEGFDKVENTKMAFKTFVYRTVLELTNNIIKHSAASHVLFQLIEIDKVLTVVVEDNGKGFDTTLTSDGHGLALLKAQTAHYQGEFELQSLPDKGTSIVIELPIASP